MSETTAAAKKPAKAPKAAAKTYKYPEVEVVKAWGPQGAITAARAKEILGWEDEEEYVARRLREEPKLKPETLTYGSDYAFTDHNGKKVRCWNNSRNRPFDEETARRYSVDVLNGRWAGPTSMPGESVNGETIIIDREGEVVSGQHRLIGIVFAWQAWTAQPAKWGKQWPTEPVLEAILVTGVSNSPRVLQTLDNVRPRSLSDVIYTSPVFGKLSDSGRKECSRMHAYAIDLLWKRLGAGQGADGQNALDGKAIQTHGGSMEFEGKHKTIRELVRLTFEANKDRAISGLGLSPGQLAACGYLMAASESDPDEYRNANPPSEKKLDLTRQDDANAFIEELAKTDEGKLAPLVEAIRRLIDDDTLTGGRSKEKRALLCKAWTVVSKGKRLKADDWDSGGALALDYHPDAHGVMTLSDVYTFGGADLGDPVKGAATDEAPPTPADAEEEKAKVRREAAEKAAAILKERRTQASPKDLKEQAATNGKAEGMLGELADLQATHPDKVLIFEGPTMATVYGDDAALVAEATGIKVVKPTTSLPVAKLSWPLDQQLSRIEQLTEAGMTLGLVRKGAKGAYVVEEVEADPENQEEAPDEIE